MNSGSDIYRILFNKLDLNKMREGFASKCTVTYNANGGKISKIPNGKNSDKINIIYLGDIITPEKILNGKLIYFDKNMDKKDIYKSKFIINKKNLRKIKCDAGRPLRI